MTPAAQASGETGPTVPRTPQARAQLQSANFSGGKLERVETSLMGPRYTPFMSSTSRKNTPAVPTGSEIAPSVLDALPARAQPQSTTSSGVKLGRAESSLKGPYKKRKLSTEQGEVKMETEEAEADADIKPETDTKTEADIKPEANVMRERSFERDSDYDSDATEPEDWEAIGPQALRLGMTWTKYIALLKFFKVRANIKKETEIQKEDEIKAEPEIKTETVRKRKRANCVTGREIFSPPRTAEDMLSLEDDLDEETDIDVWGVLGAEILGLGITKAQYDALVDWKAHLRMEAEVEMESDDSQKTEGEEWTAISLDAPVKGTHSPNEPHMVIDVGIRTEHDDKTEDEILDWMRDMPSSK